MVTKTGQRRKAPSPDPREKNPTEKEPLFIAEHMAAAGMKDQDLATAVGVERPTVTRWRLNGRRPRPSMMPKVAKAFGKTPAQLRQPPDPAVPIPSLDDLVRGKPQELQQMAWDIVRRLVSTE